MSLFDRVYFSCPECGSSIEIQSKSGECVLTGYFQEAVPTIIALDLDGEDAYCNSCNQYFVVELDEIPPETLPMRLVKA